MLIKEQLSRLNLRRTFLDTKCVCKDFVAQEEPTSCQLWIQVYQEGITIKNTSFFPPVKQNKKSKKT